MGMLADPSPHRFGWVALPYISVAMAYLCNKIKILVRNQIEAPYFWFTLLCYCLSSLKIYIFWHLENKESGCYFFRLYKYTLFILKWSANILKVGKHDHRKHLPLSLLNTVIYFYYYSTFAGAKTFFTFSHIQRFPSCGLSIFCCRLYCSYKNIKTCILQAYITVIYVIAFVDNVAIFYYNYNYFNVLPCKTLSFEQ